MTGEEWLEELRQKMVEQADIRSADERNAIIELCAQKIEALDNSMMTQKKAAAAIRALKVP